MDRTYIIGNSSWKPLAEAFDAVLVSLPDIDPDIRRALTEEDQQIRVDRRLHDFVCNELGRSRGPVIIDMDEDPVIALLTVLHIRLSLEDLGIGSLRPIVCSSEMPIESFLYSYSFSQVLTTSSVYFCNASGIAEKMPYFKELPPEKYESDFLNRIIVRPPAEIGPHSLANLWGAGVMYRLTHAGEACPEGFGRLSDVKKILYLKYVLARSGSIENLLFKNRITRFAEMTPVNARGKRILLIDDAASLGWSEALKGFILAPDLFEVVDRKVLSFADFDDSEQDIILNGDFDLIFLDLRLGGSKEEGIINPDAFSGMDVLRTIKTANRGTQVIMFTASNKAWNYKSLTDNSAGANGYYIKESPESGFSNQFSLSNLKSLKREIEVCLTKSYLKSFFSFKETVGNELDLKEERQIVFIKELKSQLDIASSMAETAATPESFQFAFLSLYQAIEIITSYFTKNEGTEDSKLMLVTGTQSVEAKPIKQVQNGILYEFTEEKVNDSSQWMRIAAILMQMCGFADNGLIDTVRQVIKLRNDFIHKDPRFGTGQKITQDALYLHPDTQDSNLLFSDPEFFSIYDSMSTKGMLFKLRRHITVNRTAITDKEGIELTLACIERIYETIKPFI